MAEIGDIYKEKEGRVCILITYVSADGVDYKRLGEKDRKMSFGQLKSQY